MSLSSYTDSLSLLKFRTPALSLSEVFHSSRSSHSLRTLVIFCGPVSRPVCVHSSAVIALSSASPLNKLCSLTSLLGRQKYPTECRGTLACPPGGPTTRCTPAYNLTPVNFTIVSPRFMIASGGWGLTYFLTPVSQSSAKQLLL